MTASAARRLALFDLDHTLIPFDSGMAWTQFLVGRGALPAEAEARYLGYCHQYVAGTLDIHDMHRAHMAPLARFAASQLAAWQTEFAASVEPRVPASARELVRRHLDAGDVCLIVTATTRLVAEPMARLFDVPHLLCTEAVVRDGVPTGDIDGLPCYAGHKVTRVQAWLDRLDPPRQLGGFESSWFYSDSASDLPLLKAVSHPVVVRPDARLSLHAQAAGWPQLSLD
ncbi:HAD family phosphatase [Ideonella sp. A 288]|uniref:HAD family hydrolase n=1 Tax=Ideonella sp. A 288 TaxID=1962181 RepID=UPI000B4C1482|nr:HAD family hydrolase [Ideonella sp. A 288]